MRVSRGETATRHVFEAEAATGTSCHHCECSLPHQTNTLETQSEFLAVSACSSDAAQCLNSRRLNASLRKAKYELLTLRKVSKQRLL